MKPGSNSGPYPKWIDRPSTARALAVGIVLGLAQLTKATLIIFLPVLPVCWLIWRVWRWRSNHSHDVRRDVWQMLLILAVAIYILNCGYGFKGTLRPLGDYQFVSKALGGTALSAGTQPGNRFRGTFLQYVPVPFPKDYVLGIDQQKSLFDGKYWRFNYLRGQLRREGWWYYYLYCLAVKVPMGTLALLVFAIASAMCVKETRSSVKDELLIVVPALVILTVVSAHTVNRHMRYILPAFPFMFVYISRAGRMLNARHVVAATAVGTAVVMTAWSSISIYPHSLSYFNEIVGGPRRGHAHLINSNIDWGQDLLLLKEWLRHHPEVESIRIAHSNCFDPYMAGIEYSLPPIGPTISGKKNRYRLKPDQMGPLPGWHAISVNFLEGYPFGVQDGDGNIVALPIGSYAYFKQFRPVDMVGYSIYIYHITPEEANRVRRELGLPELNADSTAMRPE